MAYTPTLAEINSAIESQASAFSLDPAELGSALKNIDFSKFSSAGAMSWGIGGVASDMYSGQAGTGSASQSNSTAAIADSNQSVKGWTSTLTVTNGLAIVVGFILVFIGASGLVKG
jgi:hypothetical protein